ncbi:MAG: DUF1232 domain-containing protein [Deltaproteobacteria bacterium]|nr:DUF1232 domain-containing protein [Deltaproteobacteria bacterium]
MKKIDSKLSKINDAYVRKNAKKISGKDIEKVADKADEIRNKVKKSGILGRYIEDIKLLCGMVKDYCNGSYREIPFRIISSVVFTLLYILSPIDIIPDVIPVIGYIDDLMVLSLCLNLIEDDLLKYRRWKRGGRALPVA